jgi:hypothetical protein
MLPEDEADLEVATRHVAHGREIVVHQLLRIDRLKTAGLSTRTAEETLHVFETTLRILEQHERELRAAKSGK